MIRRYSIKGREGKVTWGELQYNEKTNQFKVIFRKDIDIKKENPPALVWNYINAGMYELDPTFSLDWVSVRIAPKNRHNMAEVLKAYNLTYYREIDMLEISHGKSTHDDMFMERIE
jgi:hypothetical protein